MNETQTTPASLPAPPITVDDVDKLLNSSDVIDIRLVREGRAWRCKVFSLRAAAGAESPSMVTAVHNAVVKHNEEWAKAVDG